MNFGEGLVDALSILVDAVFVNNILLVYFLGMCSYLACSKRVETAIGLGLAVITVETITVPANWLIYHGLLEEGALARYFPADSSAANQLADVDLTFLAFISFIAVIAAMVQVVEMALDRFSPTLHASLGIFLPLIAVNCAILGASLFMQQRPYTLPQATVYGFGSGVGWALAIVSLAAIRQKLRYSHIPPGLRGLGITFILTGLISMAFMCFGGIKLVNL